MRLKDETEDESSFLEEGKVVLGLAERDQVSFCFSYCFFRLLLLLLGFCLSGSRILACAYIYVVGPLSGFVSPSNGKGGRERSGVEEPDWEEGWSIGHGERTRSVEHWPFQGAHILHLAFFSLAVAWRSEIYLSECQSHSRESGFFFPSPSLSVCLSVSVFPPPSPISS